MQLPSGTIRCPTCRASQEWSDECRRCRSDLRLLRALDQEYADHRGHCLLNLRLDRSHAALPHARACMHLRPDEAAQRLLAVCALACGDWPTALAIGQRHLTRQSSNPACENEE